MLLRSNFRCGGCSASRIRIIAVVAGPQSAALREVTEIASGQSLVQLVVLAEHMCGRTLKITVGFGQQVIDCSLGEVVYGNVESARRLLQSLCLLFVKFEVECHLFRILI